MNSGRSETFMVERTLHQGRLDTFLCTRYPQVSRSSIQRLIEEGHIRVNDHVVKPTHTPRAGEQVSVFWPEPKSMRAVPEDIPLEMLYQDADLVVINKPAGLITHPGSGYEEHTLVNALLFHCQGELSGIGGVARPGIVHRLDKETSGCLVAAKNDEAHLALQRQFSERTMTKIYLAILSGHLQRSSGEIRAAIARHPTHRKRMAAVEEEKGGREARTSFRVREYLRDATLVEAQIHTGRTHQIRVHFQHLGYPVLGDATYGARQTKRVAETTGFVAERVLLHAWKLSFSHPRTGEPIHVEAPLPPDFAHAVEALRAPAEAGPGQRKA